MKRNVTAAKLVHTIDRKASEKEHAPITGMAIVDNNLFVVMKNCPEVEVYDSKTFALERSIKDLQFTNPLDIASSKEDKFIYVISQQDSKSKAEIIKFNIEGKLVLNWTTENDDGRLSTYESNLIVCFSKKLSIIEYTPEGKKVNTVPLSPAYGFTNLWHAVKLTGTHFVVSHSKGNRQRVCVVNIKGDVLRALEDLPTFLKKAYLPLCLVGHRDESVLVADARNNRVLLLTSKELQYEGLLIETNKNQMPVRLCLNESRDWVFLGVNSGEYSKSETWKGGRILIYNISK